MTCPLCLAIHTESWLDYYGGFAIIRTLKNKGHSKRVMVLSGKHDREIQQRERETATAFLFRFISEQHRDHDWTIMEPTHASIPEHWHLVACTLDEGDDQSLIADTDRIEIRFKKRGDTHHCECPNKKCGFCHN